MNKNIIRVNVAAVALSVCAVFGLSSCDTGTSPGETNVERSDIREEGSIVGSENENKTVSERDSMESHYDHADHENHNGEKAGAVHAGDGKKDGTDRGDIDN